MNKQTGVVSMMSALMVSVLMIVITMGLIVYLNSSSQQGSDDELSLRAYAAAEGGVEWGYNYVLDNPGAISPYTTCNASGQPLGVLRLGAATVNASFQNTITCLEVTNSASNTTGNFSINPGGSDSTQAVIYGSDPVKWIRVQWLKTGEYAPLGGSVPTCSCYGNSGLPNNDGTAPPAIELTIVNYAGNAGSENPSSIKTRNVVLIPDPSPNGVMQINNSKATVACASSATYWCDTGDITSGTSLKICANYPTVGTPGDCTTDAGSGNVTIVYARPLYLNATHSSVSYQLQFFDSTHAAITVPSSNTTIDVTARSGPVYRRVVAEVPISNVPGGLNYVLFSDHDVCKDFAVPEPNTGIFPIDLGGCGYPVSPTGGLKGWRLNPNGTGPFGLQLETSVIANGYIYEIGGYGNGSPQKTVYYAKLNADGTTGAWITSPNQLPGNREWATSVVANGFVYDIGGYDGAGNYENTTSYAKLNADGSIGTWTTSPVLLPTKEGYHVSGVANGYVYVIGGYNNAFSNAVYYAKLNADGSIGAWATSAHQFKFGAENGIAEPSAVFANGYVYVIGGYSNAASCGSTSNLCTTVYYAQLTAGGDIGPWQLSANPLPYARAYAMAVVANGFVYELGGQGNTDQPDDTHGGCTVGPCGPFYSTVYFAKLNADGTTGAWQLSGAPLASPSPAPLAERASPAAVVGNGYIYVLGGVSNSGITQSTVLYTSSSQL